MRGSHSKAETVVEYAIYKITYILRALWMAERRVVREHVNMVVTSRWFAFRVLISQARIWKSSRVENSTSLLYVPIPNQRTFKVTKIRILESFFLQNKNWLREQDFVYQTSRLVRISLLISAITKSFAFFLGKVNLQKQKKKLFCYIWIAWRKRLRGWENSSTVMQKKVSRFLPTPLVFISGCANTENVCWSLNI